MVLTSSTPNLLPLPLELSLDAELDFIITDFTQEALVPGVSIVVHRHSSTEKASETVFENYGIAYDDEPVSADVSPLLNFEHVVEADITDTLPNLLDDQTYRFTRTSPPT